MEGNKAALNPEQTNKPQNKNYFLTYQSHHEVELEISNKRNLRNQQRYGDSTLMN